MEFPYSTEVEFEELETPGEMFLADYLSKFPEEQLVGEGFNLLNPMTWFTRKAQAAIRDADKGKKGEYSTDTLAGKLLERRRMLAEFQNKY